MANWVQVTNDDDVWVALNLDHATWLYPMRGNEIGTTVEMVNGETHRIKESLFWNGSQWTTDAPDFSMQSAVVVESVGSHVLRDYPHSWPST